MCTSDKACGACSSSKKGLKALPPGYIRTKVMFYSGDGTKINGGADNSLITFNLSKPLNSVVSIDWTNTDLFYQLVSQPAIVSIDQLPNPNFTTAGVGYFALILSSNNFIRQSLSPTEQPPRSYAQLTFRISDKTGALIPTLAAWTLELEFIQKINN